MFTSPTSWRRLLIGCWVALTVASCGHHSAGQATAGPPNLNVDSLIISLDDMRQLTGVPGLGQNSELRARPHQGGYGQNIAVPCRARDFMDVAFGDTWTQFKGLDFFDNTGGGYASGVIQAVGVYPDDKAAHAAFDRLITNLRQCSALHREGYEFSVEQEDPSNFALCYDQCRTLYRVKDSVVIEVAADEFHDSATVAQTVMQTISDRITSG